MTRLPTPSRSGAAARVLVACAALAAWVTSIRIAIRSLAASTAAMSTVDGGLLAAFTAAIRRRFTQLRTAREAGLTTVEVAIITAVLLGLATALVAAITIVVNRNTSRIT